LNDSTNADVTTGAELTLGSPLTLASDITFTKLGGGTLTIGSAVTQLGNASIQFNGGVIHLAGNVNVAGVGVGTGATVRLAGNDRVIVTTSLSIAGTLDLTTNSAIIDYTGPSPINTIRALIIDGSLTSSAAGSAKRLGYTDNMIGGLTVFSGQSVDPTSVLVKYTFVGDADLNGLVDIDDLGLLASHWQSAGVWSSGDFDDSGFIDINDLGLLASNWQAGVGGPNSPTAQPWPFHEALSSLGLPSASVPEPAGLGLLIPVALKCHRRWRKR